MRRNNRFNNKHYKTFVGEMKSIFKGKLSCIEKNHLIFLMINWGHYYKWKMLTYLKKTPWWSMMVTRTLIQIWICSNLGMHQSTKIQSLGKCWPGNNIPNSNFNYVKEDETDSSFQFNIGTLPLINIENKMVNNNNFKTLGIRMTFWGNVTLPSSTCKIHSNVFFPHETFLWNNQE